MPLAKEPNIKGLSLLNRYNFVRERFGDAGLAKVEKALSPELARLFTSSSAAEWYPLRTLVQIDRTLVDQLYGGNIESAREFGIYNLEMAVKTVYRLVLRFFDPTTLINKSATMWSKMVDQGRLEVVERGPRNVCIRLCDLSIPDEVYCQVLVGSFMGALRCCGVPNPHGEHTECTHHGAAADVFVITW